METREYFLFGVLGAAGVLYLLSRTRPGEQAVSGATDTIGEAVNTIGETVTQTVSAVRGIRNNNPGNIRKSAEQWQGLANDQTDSAFFQFVSMSWGIRAMVKILRNYQDRYGLDTVRKIINRWAPPNENNTGAYVTSVANDMGVSPDAPIDTHDEGTIFALVRAIIKHENGAIAAALVFDTDVTAGIDLA